MTLDDLAILRSQYEHALDEMAEAAIDIEENLDIEIEKTLFRD